MHRLAPLPLAVATLALTACTVAGPTTPTSPEPAPPTVSAPPASPTAPVPPYPAPGTTMPAIEFTRTGGFAGVHETLVVDSDGHWRSSAGSGQLGAAARTRLAELLADPGLLREIAEAEPGRCCDMFQYVLRIGDRTFEFGEPDLGPRLIELLSLLQAETGF